MGRDGHVRRRPDDLIGDHPLLGYRILGGEKEWTGKDIDILEGFCQIPTELLQVSPVVSVKPRTHLGGDVGEEEGLIHGLLTTFGISRRDKVTPIIATSVIVLELGPK